MEELTYDLFVMSLNSDLADLFAKLAAILQINNAAVFKSIAFSRVSRVLGDLTFDIKDAVENGTLDDIEGIGKSSGRIISDFIKTGSSKESDELLGSVPPTLLPMLNIPGLGPKTISLLWKERGVESVEQLKEAIETGKLDGLKGIGAKKLESILAGIELLATAGQRLGLPIAMPVAEAMVSRLRALKGVKAAEIAGSLRRRRETIGDVDLVVGMDGDLESEDAKAVAETFVKAPQVARILGQGESKSSVLTKEGLQVDLRIVPIDSFGAALQYFTGSKDHNVKLRGIVLDRGMTLNEWGLFKLKKGVAKDVKDRDANKGALVAAKTEKEIYEALGMDYIEPELREDRGEIELAAKHELPKLVTTADIRGDLHTHTNASDGVGSIETMIEAAIALKYSFYAITDHSKGQVIANGLTAERLMQHAKAVRKAAAKYAKQITVWIGSEVDILPDGRLDYEDAVLAELDWVVASPHISLKQEAGKATDRILRAIDNPYVNVIGHATGRQIGMRAGLPLEMGKVVKAAAANGTALEINAGWPRLDIDDIQSRMLLNAGGVLSVNTDAHSIEGLLAMPLGLTVARRAGATARNVLNCGSAKEVAAFVAAKRPR